jgi:hypothetical protein
VWAVDTYKKVTSSDEIAAGKKYVLVCESKDLAMMVYSSGTYCGSVSVTISNNKVTAVTDINVLSLEATTDGWYIKQEDGKYLYSSKAKELKADATNKTKCTISDNFQIVMGSSGTLQYNASSPRFCPYTSTQTAAYLYVKEEASPLASISLSGTYQTVFHQGDVFTHDGVVVTATYENSNTADVTNSASFSSPDMTTIGNKTVTVSYTENNVTKTATYNITVNAPATLTSITLSGDYATVFTQFETFNHDGLTVTANYDDNTSKNVTNVATYSDPDMTTAGTKTVTVTYTEKNVTKEATYEITVNEYVQPTEITLTLNNSFFGTSFNGADAKGSGSHSGVTDGVTVNFISGGDKNNFYINNSEIRAYSGNELEFTAPNGYYLRKIVFTKGSNWAMNSADSGTLDAQTWIAESNTTNVSFDFSGRTDMTTVVVTLGKPANVSINAACTDGTKYYGTYSNNMAFVVPSDLTVSAISVSAGKLIVTNYETGDIVEANTGVMISATSAGNKTLILTPEEGVEVSGNMLKASGDDGISADQMTGGDKYYRLTMHNGETLGFWWGAENGAAFALAANKAYLAVPAAQASAIGFEFDDETTGIVNVNRETTTNNQYYTLDGRRVAEPTKGIYIINGKKVILK